MEKRLGGTKTHRPVAIKEHDKGGDGFGARGARVNDDEEEAAQQRAQHCLLVVVVFASAGWGDAEERKGSVGVLGVRGRETKAGKQRGLQPYVHVEPRERKRAKRVPVRGEKRERGRLGFCVGIREGVRPIYRFRIPCGLRFEFPLSGFQ